MRHPGVGHRATICAETATSAPRRASGHRATRSTGAIVASTENERTDGALPRTLADAFLALPILLNVDDMAQLLRMSSGAVYAAAARGKLPPPLSCVGRRLLWDRAAVLSWLSEGRANSPGGNGR